MADTLEFQNLKHIKSGLGLTPVSIVDKCLGCLLYSRVHGSADANWAAWDEIISRLSTGNSKCCCWKSSESASNAHIV